MPIRTGLFLFLLASLPAVAQTADWVVYQQGDALELSLDRRAVWVEKDGLVHFVNQERFAERQTDKATSVQFNIRRTEGYADCKRQQYVFVGLEYYSRNNKHLYSTMFPVPRYAWKWQPVYQGSVADTMLENVCNIAQTAPRKKPE
ncbi:surface-adhesin E family protein [uncultured Aquitalea sp.]|uniref:surface-adhesin E family protein n=1 Tax=uncultured Aquitalea sp. TaxID=540272 RepID=UPI0025E9F9C6|nr:surface-adhesin E family protein [uncultured Aquitalea sp.]